MEHEMLTMEREIGELKKTSGTHTAQIKTLFEDVRNLNDLVKTVQSLAQAVQMLAQNQGTIQMDIQGLKTDISDIKSRPIKQWKSIAEKVVLTAVGILVGWLLKQFGIF